MMEQNHVAYTAAEGTFPLRDAIERPFRTHAAGGLDILVVEDDPALRHAMELTLEYMGHLVFSASSLREAREVLNTFAVDLLICDLLLPDGRSTELMAGWPDDLVRVPSILITGLPANAAADGATGRFDALLAKPVPVAHLERTIDRLAPSATPSAA